MITQKTQFINSHKKQYRLEITQKVSFCSKCSSAIIKDKSGKEISTIKPLKYCVPQETCIPSFLIYPINPEDHYSSNKSNYIKIRKDIVKIMKSFCEYFGLTQKTFFLALDYFDRINPKLVVSSFEDLKQISFLCIILATKFQENGAKGMKVKNLSLGTSTIYAADELFILRLLKYDLHAFTCYDILKDILYTGFLFNDENFSLKKMELIYDKIENMLYLFSESKYYTEYTHKEIAISIIGLIRERLGFPAFSKNFQIVFMNELSDIHNYLSCLNRLRKIFKFKENINSKNNILNNHSDSTTESNSDNNSDSITESISSYNLNKNSQNNVKNSPRTKLILIK